MSETHSIFLSHSHQDKPFVRRLADDLKKQGVRVWLDEAEMLIGDSLLEKIGNAIEEIDFVGAILSTHSVNSPWVIRELDIAINQEIKGKIVKVLPLIVGDCIIPLFLTGKLYADFRDASQYEENMRLLMRRLSTTNAASAASGGGKRTDQRARKTIEDMPGSFEMKLLLALTDLRRLTTGLGTEAELGQFLNELGEVGDFIRISPASFLVYRHANSFLDAYNAAASQAGNVTKSDDELRDILSSLQHELDILLIEVGIQSLRSTYPGDRERAARILGQIGPAAEAAVGPLRKTLKDPSGAARSAAAWALTAIGTDEAKRAVEDYEKR